MDTELLARLIDRKREVLRQLQLLSQRQQQMVCHGEMSLLISVLAAKQRLLHDLQAIERELQPYRGQDPESRCWKSAAERGRVRAVAAECESVLADIMQLERRCEQELLVRRDAAAAQLHGAHGATQAALAYAAPAAPVTQLDVSSET
jgi:hypothetical protein